MTRQIVSTLDGYNYIYHARRSGNTTRLIDKAIQLIFKGKKVKVFDHNRHGSNNSANQNLFDKIIDRMHFEHSLTNMLKDKKITIDKKNMLIYLNDEKE